MKTILSLWNSLNLEPKPIEEKRDGKKIIVRYESFPWSLDDFLTWDGPSRKTTGQAQSGALAYRGLSYRGKPLTVTPNPYVWVLTFQRIKP